MKDLWSTVLTVLALVLLMVFLIWSILNMEEPDYIEMVNNITPEEMADINSVRLSAFNYALSCSGADVGINFEDIRWFIYPDTEIRFSEGRNYLDLAGWYDQQNDAIWIAYPYRKTRWVNSHEVLHKLGYVGHGPVFSNCNLLAEQQP